MVRRRRGEGAVYRRQDGRWEAQLRLPDGRRKSIYASTRGLVAFTTCVTQRQACFWQVAPTPRLSRTCSVTALS